jgi:hypothetical protein
MIAQWLAYVALALMSAPASQASASVRITQKHLTPLCLDGHSVKPGERHWTLPAGEHVLIATMKNDPRSGMASADPGAAEIRFKIRPAHRYEVEVRAAATSFSKRVWTSGEWTPVVRDRTADAIVSGEVSWTIGTCK